MVKKNAEKDVGFGRQFNELKKKHPCGSYEWEILRTGADFKLKCRGCGHMIMVPRTLVEKNLKGIK